jgi:hypothetical protein
MTAVTSSLLGPNISFNIILSNAFHICAFLIIRDQVSHAHKTTGKIIIFYILIFTFIDGRGEPMKLIRFITVRLKETYMKPA